MKRRNPLLPITLKPFLPFLLAGLFAAGSFEVADAQFLPPSPENQRSAIGALRSQVSSLRNIASKATTFTTGQHEMVWNAFQSVQRSYAALKAVLSQQQLLEGANQWAELDAGLEILEETFANYQADVDNGQSAAWAFRNMCRVLGAGAGVWLEEFNRVCRQLRVGW